MEAAFPVQVQPSHLAPSRPTGLQRLDFRRLFALGALLHLEAHTLVFLQGLETTSQDLGKVRKQIISTIVRRNESETLRVIEPLHKTCCHFSTISKKVKSSADWGRRRLATSD
jgi:hypothetical protein